MGCNMRLDTITHKLVELDEVRRDRAILLGELRRAKIETFRSHIIEQIKGMTQQIKKISQELLSEGVLA